MLFDKFQRVPLIERPTPLVPCQMFDDVLIKREDVTAPIYGGNKVRNLEFVLGAAKQQNANSIYTLIPTGSNFSAAIATHGVRHGFDVRLFQMTLAQNEQIRKHESFALAQGAVISKHDGLTAPALALKDAVLFGLTHRQSSFHVTPGASSVLGAMGHARALFEIPEDAVPDYIFVGAGTCGTTAGLLAGIKLRNLKTRVIAVRCAGRSVCNGMRIERLGNKLLRLLESHQRISSQDYNLVEGSGRYGHAPEGFDRIQKSYLDANELELDSTYTSKVILKMQEMKTIWKGGTAIYWHTFSPLANRWGQS
ncbi:MAG: pyridoxal-phosphate dependent enzyme [Proteobacteria bacterium]|nr:pyridoxal-phosphate dependent enzyme [Pseudomonadota bacterium]